MIALDWGHGEEETAARLLEVSEKAQERVRLNDRGYARVTVQHAAECVNRNRATSRRTAAHSLDLPDDVRRGPKLFPSPTSTVSVLTQATSPSDDVRTSATPVAATDLFAVESLHGKPHRDPTADEQHFECWKRERCVSRAGKDDWGGIKALLADFALWCSTHGSATPPRDAFEALLGAAGHRIENGLASGLILRDDLNAIFRWQRQAATAKPQPSPRKSAQCKHNANSASSQAADVLDQPLALRHVPNSTLRPVTPGACPEAGNAPERSIRITRG